MGFNIILCTREKTRIKVAIGNNMLIFDKEDNFKSAEFDQRVYSTAEEEFWSLRKKLKINVY